ncbi:MAG: DNA polymerase III subunit beta [Duncaniella sp.]|nr:DNA polymerase III subunit beta [Duncaniella sp.]
MKFTVPSKLLHGLTSSVSKVINAKNALTILNYFLFEIKDNTLTVTACDGENTLCGRIGLIDVDGEGEVCIDARKMVELLRVMPEQELRFDVDDDTLNVELRHPDGSYRFMGLPGREYPRLEKPSSENTVSFTAKGSTLLRGLDYTAFATGTEIVHPQMMGVYLDIKPESITFVATDSRRLVKFEDKGIAPGVTGSLILPNKSTNVFRQVYGKEEEVTVTLVPEQGVIFETPSYTFESRLIKGNYPAYDKVIPRNNPYELRVNRQQFITAVRRVSLFVDEGHGLIKFRVTPDRLEVKAVDNQYSTSGEETLGAEYTGDSEMVIGFSSTYLIELASVLWTEDILFRLADRSRPAVILPVENKPDTDLTMILMPMNVIDF